MKLPARSSGPWVVGVGIDLADVARLEAAMGRRAGVAGRLFTAGELEVLDTVDALAVAQRFAAKEAVMKALGVGIDSVSFTDIDLGAAIDTVELSGRARQRAAELGATHFTLEVGTADGPDGPVATAEVIASSTVA
ncbi:MAG: holo-ACP synthase [Microthrixaceae bacterium]